jgi:HK97 gp10 family phage protein
VDLNLNVQGLDQLEQNLKAFSADIQEKALNTALVEGARVIAAEMKAEAPRGHDIGPRAKTEQHVADSIVIKVEPKPIGSAAEVYVGPSKRVSSKARWLELGAAAHGIVARLTRSMRKRGEKAKKVLASPDHIFGTHVQHPGIRPRPFMRPALDVSAKDAIEAIANSLKKSIAAAARRANRKNKP